MKRQTIEYALMAFTTLLISALLCILSFLGLESSKHHPVGSAKYSVSSNVLQQQFSSDEQVATSTYLNASLAVDGIVKSVEKDHKGDFTVVIGDSISKVLIRCAVERSYQQDASDLQAGAATTIRGTCKGFNMDKLAGLNVLMAGCSIHR